MRLNSIGESTRPRLRRKRVGRGGGSGLGKTAGRGHKGQKSRSGGGVALGFEGGQMPLHRRLPKVGFRCRRTASTSEVRTGELGHILGDRVTLAALKRSGLVPRYVKAVKIVNRGVVARPIIVEGLSVSQGARVAIESLGGQVLA